MKISTEIESSAKILGEERAIVGLAEAGFDAWDFSMFRMCNYNWSTNTCSESDHPLAGNEYLKFAATLRRIGLEHGIECNQSHAPFPTCCPEIRSYYKRAIECTAEAGGKICVIHPDNHKGPQENAEMYLELLPFAKDCGVKIATENMWNWDKEKDQSTFAACATPESFLAHLQAVNDPYFVACLDIGHAEMRGSETTAVEMIRSLGSHLQALHIHDNDQWHDSHQIPFSMKIDFAGVVNALKEVHYDGYLTLEASYFLENDSEEKVFEGIKQLAGSAKRLSEMFEA